MKNLFALFFFTFLSILTKGERNNHAQKQAHWKDIYVENATIGFDTTKQATILSSEKPKKISQIQGVIINWMGVLMEDSTLWHKRMKSFFLYVTNKKQSSKDFEIEFFSLGENGLPDKKLTSAPFEFSLYKKGWNEFEIPTSIEVPKNGIILAFRYKKQKGDWKQQINNIGLGAFTTHKLTFIVHKSDWIEFPIYQPYQKKFSRKISLMFKISTYS